MTEADRSTILAALSGARSCDKLLALIKAQREYCRIDAQTARDDRVSLIIDIPIEWIADIATAASSPSVD